MNNNKVGCLVIVASIVALVQSIIIATFWGLIVYALYRLIVLYL